MSADANVNTEHDSEYYSESYSDSYYDGSDSDGSDSDGSDDCDSYDGSSDESQVTYTSLEATLADMTARLTELDKGLQAMNTATQVLEHPVKSVAISSFTNPRILENAPFRKRAFKLHTEVQNVLGLPSQSIQFMDLCAAIRSKLKSQGSVFGTGDFLQALQLVLNRPAC